MLVYNNKTTWISYTDVASLYHVEIILVLRVNIVWITKALLDLLKMWSQFPLLISTSLTLGVTSQLLPTKDEVLFSTPWIQAGLGTCFAQQNVLEETLCQSRVRSQAALHASTYSLRTLFSHHWNKFSVTCWRRRDHREQKWAIPPRPF